MSIEAQQAAGERTVLIAAGDVVLEASLVIPQQPLGIVVFAHGSGSSRHSPRNLQVAAVLQRAGMATMLLDLLTPKEVAIDERSGHLRFEVDLLAARLVAATDWLSQRPETRELKLGYFGASTGAAAAFLAAADCPEKITAIVSRGGRPDLAGAALDRVGAPTLLIVGGIDTPVIAMNRHALHALNVEKKLVIVPGASHLFEEPGTLEEVARLASDWFDSHFQPPSAPPPAW